MLRLLPLLSAVLIACASRTAVVQSGAPEPAPSTAATPAPARVANATWADTARPFATLSRGWNRIHGRDGTGCAEDSTFVFKVRPGLSDKVLIFLNGGGTCWRGGDCDPRGKPTYTTNADVANDVSARAGIFDVNNDANPLREYTMIFVSYCTGDAHLGARTAEYESRAGKRTFSIRHQGSENLESVLDWVYSNFRSPRAVFVAGMDAGAIASPVVAEKIARHYPRARVAQLGDGAGALRGKQASEMLQAWGAPDYLRRDAAFRSISDDEFTFERLYVASARAAPRVHYAQVSSAGDATQRAQLAQLRGSMPWFRSYTMPGRAPTILRSQALYTTKVDGVPFSQWLALLVDGEGVADVGNTPR